MKTTLSYLLITFAVIMVVNAQTAQAKAQTFAKEPTTDFQSTSTMVGSGTTLPQAIKEGTYTTYDESGMSTLRSNKPGIRKDDANGDGFEDEEDPDKPSEPFPIGDGVGALLLAAAVYLIWCVARRRARNDVASQR